MDFSIQRHCVVSLSKALNPLLSIQAVLFYLSVSFPLSCVLVSLYPLYEVYRGYIVFAFSVIMFVCVLVCLSVCKLFFLSKIFQQLLDS